MDEFASLLPRGLAALGMETDAEVEEKLRRYIVELETWNPAYGLVNATGGELVIKHILDSLAPWKLLKATLESCDKECFSGAAGSSKVSDIGTGAGLPGIPLAIAMKERGFRLVERMGKRVTFLESQKALLPLPNVEIVESEVERAPGPHDVVVFRAFRPLTETRLFRSIWKNLRPGGALFAYKGKALNVKLELAALATDPLLAGPMSRARIEPVWVPFLDEDRCVVIIRKEEESQPIL